MSISHEGLQAEQNQPEQSVGYLERYLQVATFIMTSTMMPSSSDKLSAQKNLRDLDSMPVFKNGRNSDNFGKPLVYIKANHPFKNPSFPGALFRN